MPTVTITAHKHGVPPLEAVRAYAKNQDEGMSLDDIIAEGDVVNYQGDVPGKHALWSVQVVMVNWRARAALRRAPVCFLHRAGRPAWPCRKGVCCKPSENRENRCENRL